MTKIFPSCKWTELYKYTLLQGLENITAILKTSLYFIELNTYVPYHMSTTPFFIQLQKCLTNVQT